MWSKNFLHNGQQNERRLKNVVIEQTQRNALSTLFGTPVHLLLNANFDRSKLSNRMG